MVKVKHEAYDRYWLLCKNGLGYYHRIYIYIVLPISNFLLQFLQRCNSLSRGMNVISFFPQINLFTVFTL